MGGKRPEQRMKRSTRKGKQDIVEARQRAVHRQMDNVSATTAIVRRRLVIAGNLLTIGTGFIPATQVTSATVATSPEWASMSARYSQFRVRGIRVRLYPIVDSTIAAATIGPPHPTALAFAAFREANGYPTYTALVAGAGAKVFNGREPCIEYSTDWSGNPDAKLWGQTAALLPIEQRIGIQFQDTGVAPASNLSTAYYRLIYDFDVEFVMPL